MIRRECVAGAFLVSSAAVALMPAPARASTYTFTRIADTAGPLATVANPAINAGGDVVFRASLDAGGQAIYVGSGGAITKIADNATGSVYQGFGDPVINAGGTVAFFAGRVAGGQGVFTVTAGTTGTVALTTGAGGTFSTINTSSLAINTGGLVSFSGSKSSGPGVYAGVTGGTPGTVADSSGPLASFGQLTTLNDTGVAAFVATPDAGGSGVYSGTAGGSPTTIADTTGPLNTPINGASINTGGVVAFTAALDAGGSGLFTGTGGALTTVTTTAGPFASFATSNNGPSMNASGKIVFRASPDVGNDGYFDGINPTTDKIIAIGDALDGSTVASLTTLGGRLNDAGQYVFEATLDDGRQGIYRANPTPEPGTAAVILGIISSGALTNRAARTRRLR